MMNDRIGTGLLLAATLCLAACGGGSGGSSTASTTVSGTAASGAPLSNGSVALRCQNAWSGSTTTNASGQWSLAVPAANLPCAVQATSSDASTRYYAFTIGNGGSIVTNVTPLTSLALARAAGMTLDAAWFTGLSDADRQSLASGLAAAIAALNTALAAYDAPDAFNPFTLAFVAQLGNIYDDLLEQLQAALAAADQDFDDVLADFAEGGELPAPVPEGPANTGGGSDTIATPTLSAGEYGVRFATNGTVQGTAESGVERFWSGHGEVTIPGSGASAGKAKEVYLTLFDPFRSFALNSLGADASQLPAATGTYTCGQGGSGAADKLNIVLAYAAGQGYSSEGTRGVTGFSCAIDITHVGSVSGSSYTSYIEGNFKARLFKTAAPVSLANSIVVSGSFRLGN